MNWFSAFLELLFIAVYVATTAALDWLFSTDTKPLTLLFGLVCVNAFRNGLFKPKRNIP